MIYRHSIDTSIEQGKWDMIYHYGKDTSSVPSVAYIVRLGKIGHDYRHSIDTSFVPSVAYIVRAGKMGHDLPSRYRNKFCTFSCIHS